MVIAYTRWKKSPSRYAQATFCAAACARSHTTPHPKVSTVLRCLCNQKPWSDTGDYIITHKKVTKKKETIIEVVQEVNRQPLNSKRDILPLDHHNTILQDVVLDSWHRTYMVIAHTQWKKSPSRYAQATFVAAAWWTAQLCSEASRVSTTKPH